MWLENVLRYIRVRKVKKYVPKQCVLLDIGCGNGAYFLHTIQHKIKKGIGIDQAPPLSSQGRAPASTRRRRGEKQARGTNLEFITMKLEKQLPISGESVDCISMLAVLEHVLYPKAILQECFRALKTGGTLLLTTPLPRAKPILDFLAYTAKAIDRKEIDDHKNYFSLSRLKSMLIKSGFKIVRIKTFELQCNSFIIAKKL